MRIVMYYEMKKVFSKRSSKWSLLILAAIIILSLYFQISDAGWVNERGVKETGFGAVSKMREAKKEWSGVLDVDKIRQVIEENNRINNTPQARSDDISQQDIAYSWKQGFYDIRSLLNFSYGGFQDYDYYTADSLGVDEADAFYHNRINHLKEWFREEGGGANALTEQEKAFLISKYEKMERPFYYDYQDGWKNLFQWAPMIIMITTMVLGFLCAGIFSDEFRLKACAVFYSSYYGRGKAIAAKVKAGLLIASIVYWTTMLLYSVLVLSIFGADGAECLIQSTQAGWKSFYNMTNGQEYLLVMFGGYLGCLFMVILVMLVSAAAKSSLLAVMVPFVLIFLPSFLSGVNSSVINKISGILPDQLLQMNMVLKYFNLYEIGGYVMGAVSVLMIVYLILSLIFIPVIYQVYKNKQVQG